MTAAARIRPLSLRGILRSIHFRCCVYVTLVASVAAVTQFVIR